jgi:hypothetical protein
VLLQPRLPRFRLDLVQSPASTDRAAADRERPGYAQIRFAVGSADAVDELASSDHGERAALSRRSGRPPRGRAAKGSLSLVVPPADPDLTENLTAAP